MNELLERLDHPLTGQLIAVGLVGLAAWIASRLLNRAAARQVASSTLRYRMRKFVNFLGVLVVAVAAALIFGLELSQVSVALGIAGAGVAFALQEVIVSFAGWIAITVGGFYRPGDRIQLGGIKGDVIDIGVLRTTLMECGEWVQADQYTGRFVRVANSFVFKEPVFNYSGEFPFLWDEISLPFKYGSDYGLARDILCRVADELLKDYADSAEAAWKPVTRRYLVEKARVQPAVTMLANQSAVEMTLRYVVDYKLRRTTKDRLFQRLLEEIDAHADRVGIAASTLNIEKVAPLEVRFSRRPRNDADKERQREDSRG